jgi:hypothetical protein
MERAMHEDNSAVLRQKLALELTIKARLCPDYTGADHTSIVQVRQQVHYKRTLLQLENRLMQRRGIPGHGLSHSARASTCTLAAHEAKRFADHESSCVAARRRDSKQLRSQDGMSNTTRRLPHAG